MQSNFAMFGAAVFNGIFAVWNVMKIKPQSKVEPILPTMNIGHYCSGPISDFFFLQEG